MALGKKVARSIPKKKQGARDLSLNLLADTYHTADLLKNRPRNRLNIGWPLVELYPLRALNEATVLRGKKKYV